MSKIKNFEILTDSGLQYGQTITADGLMKAQEYAHQHVESLTKDFLTGANAEVAGCNRTLTGGLNISVAAGRLYHDGYQFDAVPTALTLAAAHATLARLDYVVATIGGMNPAETQFLPFQRIRTAQELTNGASPYPPTQFNRATEKHNDALIQVRTGTPAANPLPPSSVIPTDVILYAVLVPANATVIQNNNVTDLRIPVANLRDMKQTQNTANANIGTLQTQMAQALAYEYLTRPFSQFGGNTNLIGILNEIYMAMYVLQVRYPTMLAQDSRCPAAAVQDGSTWTIDIPVNSAVEFGAKFVVIYAENFPESANARYVTVSSEETKLLPIIEARDDFDEIKSKDAPSGDNQSAAGNYIRFDVPSSTKSLYLKSNGELELRSVTTPSTSVDCLLMKITPNGSGAPTLKRYLNQRNYRVKYSKVVDASNASKQFEWDLAIPPEIASYDCYRVKNDADKTRCDLPTPNMEFDATITIGSVVSGDTWYLVVHNLSAL